MNKRFLIVFSQISQDIFWTLRFLVFSSSHRNKNPKGDHRAKSMLYRGPTPLPQVADTPTGPWTVAICWGHPHFGGQGS